MIFLVLLIWSTGCILISTARGGTLPLSVSLGNVSFAAPLASESRSMLYVPHASRVIAQTPGNNARLFPRRAKADKDYLESNKTPYQRELASQSDALSQHKKLRVNDLQNELDKGTRDGPSSKSEKFSSKTTSDAKDNAKKGSLDSNKRGKTVTKAERKQMRERRRVLDRLLKFATTGFNGKGRRIHQHVAEKFVEWHDRRAPKYVNWSERKNEACDFPALVCFYRFARNASEYPDGLDDDERHYIKKFGEWYSHWRETIAQKKASPK